MTIEHLMPAHQPKLDAFSSGTAVQPEIEMRLTLNL